MTRMVECSPLLRCHCRLTEQGLWRIDHSPWRPLTQWTSRRKGCCLAQQMHCSAAQADRAWHAAGAARPLGQSPGSPPRMSTAGLLQSPQAVIIAVDHQQYLALLTGYGPQAMQMPDMNIKNMLGNTKSCRSAQDKQSQQKCPDKMASSPSTLRGFVARLSAWAVALSDPEPRLPR